MPKKTNTHFQNERNKNKMCIFPSPPQYLEHPDLSILPYATKRNLLSSGYKRDLSRE